MSASMRMDPFLIAMMVAIVLAFLFPSVGASPAFAIVTDFGVMLVFFLHGAALAPAALKAGVSNWRLHLFIQVSTYVLFPVLGIALYLLTAPFLTADLRLGVFFLAALSSTISSSVAMTALAKGNVPAAVFNATLSGLIGIVATPVLMGLVLAVTPRPLPVLDAILDVVVKLLAPFALGFASRIVTAKLLARWKPLVNVADRVVIVLIVFGSFAESAAAGIWSSIDAGSLALTFAIVSAMLAIVLVTTTWAARALRFSRPDEVTAVFCGSKKSLANGAPIAKVLFAGNPALGLIMLPLLLFHQLQLIVCGMLARRYASAIAVESRDSPS